MRAAALQVPAFPDSEWYQEHRGHPLVRDMQVRNVTADLRRWGFPVLLTEPEARQYLRSGSYPATWWTRYQAWVDDHLATRGPPPRWTWWVLWRGFWSGQRERMAYFHPMRPGRFGARAVLRRTP